MNLNIEALSKTTLFKHFSDYFLFTFLLLIITIFSMLKLYQEYLDLKRFTWHTQNATVMSESTFIKQSQILTRYKLKTNTFTFYTTSHESMRPLEGREVSVAIKTDAISFIAYVKGFYASSKFIGLYHEQNFRLLLLKKIAENHDSKMIANLYGALYLAQSIQKNLRNKLSHLGINHLAAISGFHLGFISFFILLFAHLVYKPLHQRYLPFRNRSKDVMIVTIIILFAYVALLDFTPSLLRAFGMILIGFILYDRGMKIVSFASLSVTVLLLLALFPDLLFTLGFWLSVLGVFMIFLLLQHFSHLKKWQLFLLLHWLVFILMIPFIIFIFKEVSMGQLLSPLLSMVFILFYPLSVFLTAIGFGNALDGILIWLLSWDFKSIDIYVSTTTIVIYTGLLLASIWSKKLFYVNVIVLHVCFVYFWSLS